MDNSLMEDEDFPPLPPPVSPGQGGRDDGDPFADGEEETSAFRCVQSLSVVC